MLLNKNSKLPLDTNVNVLGARVNEITTMAISWLRYEFTDLASKNLFIFLKVFLIVEEQIVVEA